MCLITAHSRMNQRRWQRARGFELASELLEPDPSTIRDFWHDPAWPNDVPLLICPPMSYVQISTNEVHVFTDVILCQFQRVITIIVTTLTFYRIEYHYITNSCFKSFYFIVYTAALSFVCHPVADVPGCFFWVFYLKDQSLKFKDEDDILPVSVSPFTEPFKWLTLTFAFVR